MSSKKSRSKTFREKASSTWGLIIIAFSLVSAGFGAGCYVENSLSIIHHNDELTRLNNLIIDNREKYETAVHELRNQIYDLKEELIEQKSLQHENK